MSDDLSFLIDQIKRHEEKKELNTQYGTLNQFVKSKSDVGSNDRLETIKSKLENIYNKDYYFSFGSWAKEYNYPSMPTKVVPAKKQDTLIFGKKGKVVIDEVAWFPAEPLPEITCIDPPENDYDSIITTVGRQSGKSLLSDIIISAQDTAGTILGATSATEPTPYENHLKCYGPIKNQRQLASFYSENGRRSGKTYAMCMALPVEPCIVFINSCNMESIIVNMLREHRPLYDIDNVKFLLVSSINHIPERCKKLNRPLPPVFIDNALYDLNYLEVTDKILSDIG